MIGYPFCLIVHTPFPIVILLAILDDDFHVDAELVLPPFILASSIEHPNLTLLDIGACPNICPTIVMENCPEHG
jgi:hypothetical protein